MHRRLALGSVLNVANLVLSAATAMALMPYVVRMLGDGQYGVWLIVGTFVGYFGLFDFGLSAAVSRYLASAVGARDIPRAQSILATALVLFSVVGAVVLVATALLALGAGLMHVRAVDLHTLRVTVLIAGAAFSLGFPLRAVTGVLQAFLRYEVVAAREIATLVLRTVFVVAAVRVGWGVAGLAWASLAALVLPAMGLVRAARQSAPDLHFTFSGANRATARELVGFSGFAFVGQIADVLRFRLDALVVGSFVGAAAVTHYGIAATLIQYFISLVTAALGVFSAVLSRQNGAGDTAALRRTFFFATKLSVLLASFAGFGLVAWGRAFIDRWMGPGYSDVYPTLVALAIGCTAALWQAPSVSLLYSMHRHRYYAAANVAEGIANLVCSMALAPHYGIFGVALGTLIPMAILKLLVQPIYVCRVTGIPLGEYVRLVSRTVASAAVCLVPAAVFTWRWASPNYGSLVAVAAVSAITYAPLAVASALSPTERRQVFAGVIARRVSRVSTP